MYWLKEDNPDLYNKLFVNKIKNIPLPTGDKT